jgi:phosphatidylglycerophosphate synthase
MAGTGPLFLRWPTADRNREVARRAVKKDPTLAGTLRFAEDSLVITQALFDWLPRDGSWEILWRADRPPFTWDAAGAKGDGTIATAPPGTVLDVRTASARRASTWSLLQRSGKPTDGWLSRYVHRRVSRVFSFMLLQLGLRANDATLLTLGIGILSAWFIAQTSHAAMIFGTLFFWFASVADGMDGEMARLTLSESDRGDSLDTVADNLTYVFCLTADVIGWWRQGIGAGGAALVLAVAIVLSATYLWGMHLVRRAAGTSRFFVETKSIEIAVKSAAAASDAVALKLSAVVFVLFRREMFSLTFLVLALFTGWRGAVFASIAGGLAVVLSTLFVYNDRIDLALKHRLAPPEVPCAEDGAIVSGAGL